MPTLDAVLVASGLALAYMVRYVWRLGGIHEKIMPVRPHILALLGAVAFALTILELTRRGSYRDRMGKSRLDSYLSVVSAATIAIAVVTVAGAALQEYSVSRLIYAYAWIFIVGLVCAGRFTRSLLLACAYRSGRGVRRVLVVGATPVGKMVMQNLASCLTRGYQLVGFIEECGEPLQRFGRFAGLGTTAELARVLREHHVDEVIVALPSASHARIADIFKHCEHVGVDVKFVPDLFDLRLSRVRMDGMARIPLIDVRVERPDALHRMLKRTFDVTAAAFMLIVTAPVLVVTALAIRLESPGPILFRQQRLGKDGKPFTILKFRSMRHDAERLLALLRNQNEASGPIFKMRRDPRVTRVGRIIRKLSIDELPQLWNVMRGDMSLVGPRPPLASEVAEYDAWHHRRLEVMPGITCLWGVSGRSALEFDEMVMLDLYYIDNWSLGLDLGILLRTALVLLRPSGAY